jgi:flagellar biogenesis protein FliO
MKQTLHTRSTGVERLSRLARRGHWIVAVALVACLIRFARADEYEPYPPPQPLPAWPDQPAPVPTDPQASSPNIQAESAPSTAPRLLPARFDSGETQTLPVTGPTPAPPAAEPPKRPLRLSRETASSPVVHPGLAGGKDAALNAAASLGIVLALFLAVAWAVRRGAPKGYTPLPTEAVEVLGRATLVGRAQVHLVRCGNKIVLVHASAGGVETLTEITDPAEVDRLHSICHPAAPSDHGWRRWLGPFGASRTVDYPGRDDGAPLDFRHLELGGRGG